jgi:low temperature requirement protein LtrA
MNASVHEKPVGVSSIKLFFDLVFVFVIAQVTQLVEHAHGPMDFRALLVLVPIWWMYAGYAWLTNNVVTNQNLPNRSVIPEVRSTSLALAPDLAFIIPSLCSGQPRRISFEY